MLEGGLGDSMEFDDHNHSPGLKRKYTSRKDIKYDDNESQ